MSTYVPGFQYLKNKLHHFVLAKSATSRIRVKGQCVVLSVRGTYQ